MENVLSLKKALKGSERLYESKGKFKFTVGIPAFAPSIPKERWINDIVVLWTQDLRKIGVKIISSYFSVYSANVKEGYITSCYPGNYVHEIGFNQYKLSNNNRDEYGKIWFEVEVTGSVNTEKLDSEVVKNILEKTKRRLGEQFRENFRPPFNVCEPKFAGGYADSLLIEFNVPEDFREDFNKIKKLHNNIKECIVKCLENKNVEHTSISFRYYKYIDVTFWWTRDANDNDRHRMADEINEKLKKEFSLDACCRFEID
ncbi:hypothetical protein KAR28_05850 [Candidatus Parcubacteria bacterium]|nr:hypothetical protein [Candidatus Parcubacteria bacterium]